MRATVSRRAFVRGLGIGDVLVAAPELWLQPAIAGTTDPEQLHLQFGEDASREVVVSWVTPVHVSRPRLRLGTRPPKLVTASHLRVGHGRIAHP